MGRFFRIKTAILSTLPGQPHEDWFGMITLVLFTIRVFWGMWRSLDWPSVVDEWRALLDGYRIANGQTGVHLVWWNSPLWPLSYAFFVKITGSIDAAYYSQRLFYSILAVVILYCLLRRLLPTGLAWVGAAWLGVSPSLAYLTWDRTDFLAAEICAWAAIAVIDFRSNKRMGWSVFIAFIGIFFRPEALLFLFSIFIFWGAILAYKWFAQPQHLVPVQKRLVLIVGGVLTAYLLIGILGVIFLLKNGDVGYYFTWVFANDRRMYQQAAQPGFYMPIWTYFEKDFGTGQNILSILSHPISLARDLYHNTKSLALWIENFSTTTLWGSNSMPLHNYLLFVSIFGIWVIAKICHNWSKGWKESFIQHRQNWITLLCLFPSIAVLIFFWVPPIQALFIAPLVVGTVLLAMMILLWPQSISRNSFAIIALAAILLAPGPFSVPRDQRMRWLSKQLEAELQPASEVSILGNLSEIVCPYLIVVQHAKCVSQIWESDTGNPTLSGYLAERQYNFIVYDNSMYHALNYSSGLKELLSNEEPQWKLVAEHSGIKIFKNAEDTTSR